MVAEPWSEGGVESTQHNPAPWAFRGRQLLTFRKGGIFSPQLSNVNGVGRRGIPKGEKTALGRLKEGPGSIGTLGFRWDQLSQQGSFSAS